MRCKLLHRAQLEIQPCVANFCTVSQTSANNLRFALQTSASRANSRHSSQQQFADGRAAVHERRTAKVGCCFDALPNVESACSFSSTFGSLLWLLVALIRNRRVPFLSVGSRALTRGIRAFGFYRAEPFPSPSISFSLSPILFNRRSAFPVPPFPRPCTATT